MLLSPGEDTSYTLFEEMCFPFVHNITLCESTRLFFISVFNMVVFRDPKKQHYFKLFVYVFLQNLLATKLLCLRLFIHFFWCRLLFFNRTRDSSLLNLEIYKTKKIPLLIIFGDIFLGAHSGWPLSFWVWMRPSSRAQTGNLWFPSASH